jgi:hypothetical protein
VAFANGNFVTFLGPKSTPEIETNAIPVYSANGADWSEGAVSGLVGTTSPRADFDLAFVTDVAVGDREMVAVGQGYKILLINGGTQTVLNQETDKCIYSLDQVNWEAATLPFAAAWKQVAYGGGRFVAVCGEDNGATSTDGINWSILPLPAGMKCGCVAFGNGKWVAGGQPSQVVATSTDGLNWTASEDLPVSKFWDDVKYGNGRFLMCATDNADSVYSEW